MNSKNLQERLYKEIQTGLKLNSKAPLSNGIDLCRALIFVLEKYNSGNYYGTIALKMTGTMIQNPREIEVTHRLETEIQE